MNVFLADEQDEPLSTGALCALAEIVLAEEGLLDDTEVTLMFVSDAAIAEYNERFLGRSGPTDVLAFPLESLQPGEVPTRAVNGPPVNLGDVIVAPAYVRRQAAENGVPFEDELSLMVVHGILHLLGWDHPTDGQAERMERRERELLAKAGRVRP